jgi:hypothetical protein
MGVLHNLKPVWDATGEKLCLKCNLKQPLTEFTTRQSGPRTGQLVAHCKSCNRETTNKRSRDRRKADPNYYEKFDRPAKLRSQYGITVEDYDVMFSQQDHGCGICGVKTPGGRTKHFHVDHDHDTGSVRGLLCHKCNRGLGLFNDDPVILDMALQYLTNHEEE